MKIKMLTSQSGPDIQRQYGHEYDIDTVEAVRLVRSGQAEAESKADYEKALKALEASEAKQVEEEKNLAATKLAEAEAELEGLVADINDAKAELDEAKKNADKVIRKHSDKGKKIVKLQAIVDVEIRVKAKEVKEALEKVAAAEKKAATKKASASTKKTTTPDPSEPKPLSKMNKGELKDALAKLEGIKAEEIERVSNLGNKDIAKYIKGYKAPKPSSDDKTGKPATAATAAPAASKPATAKE